MVFPGLVGWEHQLSAAFNAVRTKVRRGMCEGTAEKKGFL